MVKWDDAADKQLLMRIVMSMDDFKLTKELTKEISENWVGSDENDRPAPTAVAKHFSNLSIKFRDDEKKTRNGTNAANAATSGVATSGATTRVNQRANTKAAAKSTGSKRKRQEPGNDEEIV